MAGLQLDPAIEIVSKYRAELPGTLSEQAEYIQWLKAFTDAAQVRTDEDRRAAVEIAVGVANSLVQIAIAIFVVIVGFIQFGIDKFGGWTVAPITLFVLAAVFALLSMIAGFSALSRAYKRGEGRERGNAWTTLPLKKLLNLQAGAGLFSLVAFALAVGWAYSHPNAAVDHIAVKFGSGANQLLLHAQPIVIKASWSDLEIRSENGEILSLGDSRSGQSEQIEIRFER
jgi:hypothetical protein